jgi:hypothetical protein
MRSTLVRPEDENFIGLEMRNQADFTSSTRPSS